MEIYLNKNVYEAAKERIRFVYDNFKNVVVNFSGGKDSTVVLHLALEVAEEIGRLPVNVFFFDQEAEWEHNIEYIRHVMSRNDVNPIWYQVPFKINNAHSGSEDWLHCWEKGKESEWMRPKEEIAYKTYDNPKGVEHDFYELMDMLPSQHFNGEQVAALCGMRCEETPKRRLAITEGNPMYKWVLWGAARKYGKLDFDPIYDWEYSDVWKYIFDNKLEYCKIYDYMWQYGVPIRDMRISNITHETAVNSIYILQEIEPDTYNKLVKRIGGISTTSQMQKDAFSCPKELPFMFESWESYRDFLLEHLINKDEQDIFRKKFSCGNAMLYKSNKLLNEEFMRVCISSILRSDVCLTQIKNFTSQIAVSEWTYWKKNGIKKYKTKKPYIEYETDRANQGRA